MCSRKPQIKKQFLTIGLSTFLVFSSFSSIDPFTKRYKLVHNGGFPKSEVLYCSQNTVKLIKVQ